MSSTADRKRRYRARQRKGEMVLPVVVGADLLDGIVVACGLSDSEAGSREQLAMAVGALLGHAIKALLDQRREKSRAPWVRVSSITSAHD